MSIENLNTEGTDEVKEQDDYYKNLIETARRECVEKTGIESIPGNIFPYFHDGYGEWDYRHHPGRFTGTYIDTESGATFSVAQIDGEYTIDLPYHSNELSSYMWLCETHKSSMADEVRREAIERLVDESKMSKEDAEKAFDEEVDEMYREWEEGKKKYDERIKLAIRFIKDNVEKFPQEVSEHLELGYVKYKEPDVMEKSDELTTVETQTEDKPKVPRVHRHISGPRAGKSNNDDRPPKQPGTRNW